MKKILVALLIAGVAGLWACCPKEKADEKSSSPIIEKKEMKLESDLMTPEVLWAFGRVSEPEISPDNKTVLFGITYYDIPQNKGNREIWSVNTDGTNLKRLTTTPFGEYQAMWRPDGEKIGFLSAESGSLQLWEMNTDGSDRRQISDVADGITGYKYAPDMHRIAYTKEIILEKVEKNLYEGLPKATGKIYNDLMARHWDTWVETTSHLFIADYDGGKLANDIDIMNGEPFETPLKPFGGMEQITFSPDSKSLVYTCRKKTGREYSISTNSDIFLYKVETRETTNLSEGMMGYDQDPVFAPDGSKLSWLSMERDGYESDKKRIIICDMQDKKPVDFTKTFDQSCESMDWSEDGQSLFFVSCWHGTDQIYRMDVTRPGQISKITEGLHTYQVVKTAGDMLVATRMSMSKPSEIYVVDPKTGNDKEISLTNKDLLGQLAMGNVEERWIKTTDNKDMHMVVVYPPHFDPAKKYPTILFCEGGPQNTVNQFWSFRWNFQMMAANGYIIVAPNRRGVPGFGMEWLEQISGDYGGQNMKDYLSAIDAIAKEPFVDKDNLGAVGASYGGFSVYWLAGNHNKRFKAFIAHDGMFNLESQYLETEEMWFVNWDLGGPFWDKTNAVAQRSYATSPHKYVQNWDTPILVVHGELDYRIAVTQGLQAFNAAVLRGVPAEFLYFPDENHWVLKPQNGILWQRVFFNWLDRYLKS